MLTVSRNRGFTIVELLIVIVVIGILASITVVAFNSVQTRAKLTKESRDLDILANAFKMYVAEGGNFRDGVAGSAGGVWYGDGLAKSPAVAGYTNVSMQEVLMSKNYLPATFTRDFVVSFCTNAAAVERVVMIRSDPAPSLNPDGQVAPVDCWAGSFDNYTDPNGLQKMNMVKIVRDR